MFNELFLTKDIMRTKKIQKYSVKIDRLCYNLYDRFFI